jgi:DNA replication protein DnaC
MTIESKMTKNMTTGLEQWAERWTHVQTLKAEAHAVNADCIAAAADTAAQGVRDAAQAVQGADAACAQVCAALAGAREHLERVQARAAEVRDAAEAHADAFHAQGRYAGARFHSFEPQTPKQAAALCAVQAFPSTDPAAPTQTALLVGPVGVGKTLVLAAWVARFDPANGDSEFAQWRDVARSFEGLGKVAREKQLQRWDGTQAGDGAPANGCHHLALDDFGDGMDDRDVVLLGEIIDRRSNAGRITALTSNMTPKQLAAVLGERVYSRLALGGVRIPFDGADFRQQHPMRILPVPALESAQVQAIEARAAELAEQVAALESQAQAASAALALARVAADHAQAQYREALARLEAADRAPARLEAQRVYCVALDSLRADAAWLLARRDGLSLGALQARVLVVRRHWPLHVTRALVGYQASSVQGLPSCCWEPFAEELDELEPPRLGDVPRDALELLAPEPAPVTHLRVFTSEQVSARVNALAKTHRPQVVATLAAYGAKRTPDLKPEHYAPFLADLDAIESAGLQTA